MSIFNIQSNVLTHYREEKQTAKFGESRTRRLLLEAWDKLPPREPLTARALKGLAGGIPLPE